MVLMLELGRPRPDRKAFVLVSVKVKIEPSSLFEPVRMGTG